MSGVTIKKSSQSERVVMLIKDAGSLGITSTGLATALSPDYQEGYIGCLKYTSRVSNARYKLGYDIRAYKIPDTMQHRYFLLGKFGEEPRFTDEYCRKTTERLALKQITKLTWLEGNPFSLGAWVTV